MPEQHEIERHIKELLPADGSPVLNRVLMTLIGRRIEQPLDRNTYFAAVAALDKAEVVGRQSGQGGKIYRVAPEDSPIEALENEWPETKLMPSLSKYLKTVFWREHELPGGQNWIVVDTSMHGPRERWSRPDFTAISITPLRILPRPQIDVYAFELKAETTADIRSVHQALAQTRMTHYGYLVWHLPPGSATETKLAEIDDECRRRGVGLILIRDPDAVESWSVEIDPVRQNTPDLVLDTFLAERLSEREIASVRRLLTVGE